MSPLPSRLRLFPWLAFAVLAFLGCACASAQEKPPSKAQPAPVYGLSAAEKARLDDALRACGMTRSDLSYPKDRAPSQSKWKLALVQRFLADPLSGPAWAEERARSLAQKSSRRPTDLVGFEDVLGLDRVRPGGYSVHRREAEPTTPGPWRDKLRCLAPEDGFTDAELEAVCKLPFGLRFALVCLSFQIPGAVKETRLALADLSDDEKAFLAAYAPLLAIPADQALGDFEPAISAGEAARLRKLFPGPPLKTVLDLAGKVKIRHLAQAARVLSGFLPLSLTHLEERPADLAFRLRTRYGVLEIGGTGPNVHRDADFVVDLGGDDLYVGGRIAGTTPSAGRHVSFVVDLGGDDTYRSTRPFCQGGALLGAAVLHDWGAGRDLYCGALGCQGAGLLGCGILLDDGGSDIFSGGDFCQGAGCFGGGILWTDEPGNGRVVGRGNDRYSAAGFSQGFSRTRGWGVLFDRFGEDLYACGDKDLYKPLYQDRHHCLSQGFSLGVREHGAAGSVALLVDAAGNDRYLGGVHCQGAGCWYGAGFLVDLSGSDHYFATFDAQGAAVHSAAGALLDGSGDDTYVMTDGLGQGSGHDYSVGVLLDRGGDDKYTARAAAQGVGLTNGFGLLVDREGDDLYAGHGGHLQGAGRPRGALWSSGFLLDLAGRDRYGCASRDGAFWTSTAMGAGLDVPSESGDARGKCEVDGLPDVKLRDGYAYTRAKFEALYEKSIAWNVGDARDEVALARGELVAWGLRALPHLEKKMESWGGLLIWALDAILEGIWKTHRDEVEALVVRAVQGSNANALAHGLRLAAKLKVKGAGPRALALMAVPGGAYWTYTFPVAGALRLKEAVPYLVKGLDHRDEVVSTQALHALSRVGDPASIPPLLARLEHDLFLVRVTAARALARYGAPAVDPLLQTALNAEKPETTRVAALYGLLRMDFKGKNEAFWNRLAVGLKDPSWVLRGWTARVMASADGTDAPAALVKGARAGEKHPFARGAMDRALALLLLPPDKRTPPPVKSGIVDYPAYLGEDD